MSSAVVSTSAALGRPFVFEDETEVEVRLPSSASRASLDRTAPSTSLRAGLGGCPHIDPKAAQESPLARVQSAISNQKSSQRALLRPRGLRSVPRPQWSQPASPPSMP